MIAWEHSSFLLQIRIGVLYHLLNMHWGVCNMSGGRGGDEPWATVAEPSGVWLWLVVGCGWRVRGEPEGEVECESEGEAEVRHQPSSFHCKSALCTVLLCTCYC